MARERQPPPQDEDPGAPEWMVTFSDCMTLLLTFFVLLLTFSSFDDRIFKKLRVIYCDAFPTINSRLRSSKESLLQTEQIRYVDDLDKGSEKPTLESGGEGALRETFSEEYRKHKVILIKSDEIFWGKGTVISQTGRETLSTLAQFLLSMPEAVVVSENNLTQTDPELGTARAWTVIKYLTDREGLNIERFSLSTQTTAGQKGFELFSLSDEPSQPERLLEVVLLPRSVQD
jgi:chemotaxis protein MotB